MGRYLSISLWVTVALGGQAYAAGLTATQIPLVPSPDGDPSTWKRVEFTNGQKVTELWEKYHFTPEDLKAGERTVPRIYFSDIPARWGQTVAPSMTVRNKKITFLFAMAPMVLAVDEEITLERKRLDILIAKHKSGKPWGRAEVDWLDALAARYGVKDDIDSPATLDELTTRVDRIPTSLVLAQAAIESGWATSRFAAEGSALFGQWTYSGSGITPKEQRTASKGDHKIQAFETPRDSIRAYLLNLNTHRAYAELRRQRRTLREKGKPVTGIALAAGLLKYSERGQAYVEELRNLIRYNGLERADLVTLRKMRPILLMPVGEGVD